jgi:hypothetical protein
MSEIEHGSVCGAIAECIRRVEDNGQRVGSILLGVAAWKRFRAELDGRVVDGIIGRDAMGLIVMIVGVPVFEDAFLDLDSVVAIPKLDEADLGDPCSSP